MTDTSAAAEPNKSKSSLVMTLAAVGVLTLVGAGGGWVVGKLVAPAPATDPAAEAHSPPAAEAHGAPAAGEGGHGAGAASNVKALEPLIANLAYPSNSLVRLELSLIFSGNVDETVAAAVQEDILAYMRTVSLQQIQGPRGFAYLRDDLQERAKLRSEGKVADIVFRTFVIE